MDNWEYETIDNSVADIGSFQELFGGIAREELLLKAREFAQLMTMYECAIREVTTKLEVLNLEFHANQQRNPIESIQSRIKRPESIFEKMRRKGIEYSTEALVENISDVAGVRVICPFIDDIYSIADMLLAQDDIVLVQKKDYIVQPKENGYRSLHLVIEIPIFLSSHKQSMRVEVQIRTIAMNFWASLEHQIHYKKNLVNGTELSGEMRECAEVIHQTDLRMQDIRKRMLEAKKE